MLDRGQDILTDKNVVQTFVASSVGGFVVGSMLVLDHISETVLGNEIINAIGTVSNRLIEVATEDEFMAL